jgi:hypothetical protein
MRDYGIVSPRFWIGETGKALRGNTEAQVLALYLMTSPHATMTGVYHCPILYMGHETGLGIEGATKALASLIEVGFCVFDEPSETIFITRMAAYQIGESLKPDDKRVLGIKREVEKMAPPSIRAAFLAVYAIVFHLENDSPLEAPSKPQRSQEQEQEQEQDQKPPPKRPARPRKTVLPDDFGISERVKAWAAEHGHRSLERHLAHFTSYARRNGKTYADWDEALMTAIRDDWAKLGKGGASDWTGSAT